MRTSIGFQEYNLVFTRQKDKSGVVLSILNKKWEVQDETTVTASDLLNAVRQAVGENRFQHYINPNHISKE